MSRILAGRKPTADIKVMKTSPPGQIRPAEIFTIPAATGGVSSAQSIGNPARGYAQTIENGFPTQTGVRPRGGALRHATTGTRAVKRMLTYKSGSFAGLYACAQGKIFDVTTPASPTTPPAAAVTGKGGDDWIGVNFATAAGVFLVAVNGVDRHMVFDGGAWASDTPAITGTTSENYNFVWAYASRLWFIKKNTLSVYYLPVDSIGGAVTELSLKGIFPRGGSLKFGGTWSSDTGSGLNEKIVFVTTTGEAAVFTGTDPSSSTTWSRVGVYDLSQPLGKQSSHNIGGDLLVATTNGIVPLSLAVTKDPGQLSLAAVTKEVNPAWKVIAAQYSAREWSIVEWAEKNMMLVAYAGSYTLTGGTTDVLDAAVPECYVVNLETGAWNSRYTGWDCQCFAYFEGLVYFASANGRVYKAENGGSDDGTAYVFKYLEWPTGMRPEHDALNKEFLMVRTTFTYAQPFTPQLGMSTDFNVTWPTAPAAAANSTTGGFWDLGGFWDTGNTWDATPSRTAQHNWRSIGRTGYRGALQIQMTLNNTSAPDVEIVSNDIAYRPGTLVVA